MNSEIKINTKPPPNNPILLSSKSFLYFKKIGSIITKEIKNPK